MDSITYDSGMPMLSRSTRTAKLEMNLVHIEA